MGGEWVQGGRGWCGAPRTLPRLGKSGGSAAHKQARARSLPHHTQGSRPGPAAPAEAAKGGRAPCPAPGFAGGHEGQWQSRRCPAGAGRREVSTRPSHHPWLPHSRTALGAHTPSPSIPHRVAEKEPINKMSLHNLATVFGPTLLRPSEVESKAHLTLASDIWSHDVMAQVRAVLAVWGSSPQQHPRAGEQRGLPASL